MRRSWFVFAVAVAVFTSIGFARQATTAGPYKVIRKAKVGGEGGTDYIFADSVGRRLYIPRGATREIAATATTPAVPASEKRLTIFNLDTLDPVGQIAGVGGNGAAVCPNSGHGFTSDHPNVSMFDVKTMAFMKNVEGPAGFGPDGIYCDTFNDRVYVFSHPTKSAMVIDAKDGSVLGNIDLGGVPEQGVSDGKGTLYVVMQAESSIAVVDVKTMKTTAHYSFAEKGGRCNGLALDAKNRVLFVACGNNSLTPVQGSPAQPTMVIMSAADGKILDALPLAGGSDGAAFNPMTMEAFSAHGNGTMTIVKEMSPTKFQVEQNLDTMNGARTITFDSKTQHLFVMAAEFGPPPPPPPAGTTPPAGGRGGGRGAAIPGSFTIVVVGK